MDKRVWQSDRGKQTEEDVERTELQGTITLFWNKWTEYERYSNGFTLWNINVVNGFKFISCYSGVVKSAAHRKSTSTQAVSQKCNNVRIARALLALLEPLLWQRLLS